ncbi:hypothetical protein GJ496_003574 [Pomphorhynchus laevis]|nr:hypothetical protein GJ496_003574 [Pomphorhynchus laevis]
MVRGHLSNEHLFRSCNGLAVCKGCRCAKQHKAPINCRACRCSNKLSMGELLPPSSSRHNDQPNDNHSYLLSTNSVR